MTTTTYTPNPSPAPNLRKSDLLRVVAQILGEVASDIDDGVVVTDVESFSELHDFVDANEYGGLCDPSTPQGSLDVGSEHGAALVNALQGSVDAALKALTEVAR